MTGAGNFANEERDYLLRRLDQVLLLANAAVHQPKEWHNVSWKTNLDGASDSAHSEVGPFEKFIAETSLLLMLSSRVTDLSVQITGLIEDTAIATAGLLDVYRSLRMLSHLPYLALSTLGAAYVFLDQLGCSDKRVLSLLRQICEKGEDSLVERWPSRLLERSWVRLLLMGTTDLSFDDALIRRTILGRGVHPAYMDRDGAYYFTHALWSLTDFGRKPLPISLDRQIVSKQIDGMLAWQLPLADMDVLGELLLVANLVESSWSSHVAVTWLVLRQMWDESKLMPTRGLTSDSSVGRLSSGLMHPSVFRKAYHPLYVSGEAAASFLWVGQQFDGVRGADWNQQWHKALRDCERQWMKLFGPVLANRSGPPAGEVSERMLLKLVEELRQRLGDSAGYSRLISAIKQSKLTPDQIFELLVDILLICAVRTDDVPQTTRLVTAWARLRLPPSISWLESVKFLMRRERARRASFGEGLGRDGELHSGEVSEQLGSIDLSYIQDYLHVWAVEP